MCVMVYLNIVDLDIGLILINVKVKEVNLNLRENNWF